MRIFIFNRVFCVSLILGTAAIAAHAQASKAKPKPLATPPVLTSAEIISRAADYVELPVSEQKMPEKVDEKPTQSESDLIKQLNDRIKKLEAGTKVDKDEKSRSLLLNLDILTRAEQRSEALRKQLFEMIEKENSLKGRLEQIEIDIRPEVIERALFLNGSMKPEEVREARRKSLDAERRNLQALMSDIQMTRSTISVNLQKSDVMVEKIRTKLEKDIDDTFLKDDEPEN